MGPEGREDYVISDPYDPPKCCRSQGRGRVHDQVVVALDASEPGELSGVALLYIVEWRLAPVGPPVSRRLGVSVHQESRAGLGQDRSQVDSGRGLTYAALLIDYGQDHRAELIMPRLACLAAAAVQGVIGRSFYTCDLATLLRRRPGTSDFCCRKIASKSKAPDGQSGAFLAILRNQQTGLCVPCGLPFPIIALDPGQGRLDPPRKVSWPMLSARSPIEVAEQMYLHTYL